MKPPAVTGRLPDSLQTSQAAFIAGQHPAPLPPIDTSRIQHGVAPVRMTGVPPSEIAAVPQSATQLQQQLFGKPTLEIADASRPQPSGRETSS